MKSSLSVAVKSYHVGCMKKDLMPGDIVIAKMIIIFRGITHFKQFCD